MKAKEIFTIPNVLSMFRIVLIPFIVLVYFLEKTNLCILLIALSAVTDIVDGFIARRFNMISPLGKALDPIADKLTLLAMLFSICIKFPPIIILLVIFICKEVFMGIEGLLIIKYTGTTYSAKWYGKLTTVLTYLTIMLFVLFPTLKFGIKMALITVCVAVIIFSFVLYSIMNFKKIKNIKEEKVHQEA